MTRQLNKMLLSEALEIFGFDSNSEVTKKTIMKRYRELSLLNHPDKGGDERVFVKIADAKEVLMRDFGAIGSSRDADGKPIKSVGSVFINWIKSVDVKGIKNPFTTYQTRTKK